MDFRMMQQVFTAGRQNRARLYARSEEHLRRAEQSGMLALERARPFWERAYDRRRKLATGILGVLAIWLFIHVVFGANGMVVYEHKKSDYRQLQQEIGGLDMENGHYAERIKNLKNDPQTIEREAREQLRYARPGEVVYVAPSLPPAEKPASNAARK
jgi:cell division protein FtsB